LNLGSQSFGLFTTPVLGTYAGTISNNTFSNSAANGIQAGIQHVLVTGNTFNNNTLSVWRLPILEVSLPIKAHRLRGHGEHLHGQFVGKTILRQLSASERSRQDW